TGVTVLVVDDEADARDVIATVLESAGAQIHTACSVSEALMLLEHLSPDLLLSDVAMPGEDGLALIRKVRALARGARLPARAPTAYARDEDRSRVLGAGFTPHLGKPVDPDVLVAAVTNLTKVAAPVASH